MSQDLTDLGVAGIRDGFRAGEFSGREVADALLAALEAAITDDKLELQISVEVVDIDRDSYAKRLRNRVG